MIRVLIACDVRLYREGLARMLGDRDGLMVVGTAAQSDEAVERIATLKPDVLLLDITMAGSVSISRTIAELRPDVKLVAIAASEVENQVLMCAEAGVCGYVPRDASVEDLIRHIESALRGEALCSPRVAAALFRRVAVLSAERDATASTARLTARERQIMALLDRGLSNKRIAGELDIQVATVKNHLHNIFEKLGVHRRGEAARTLRADPAPDLPRLPVARDD